MEHVSSPDSISPLLKALVRAILTRAVTLVRAAWSRVAQHRVFSALLPWRLPGFAVALLRGLWGYLLHSRAFALLGSFASCSVIRNFCYRPNELNSRSGVAACLGFNLSFLWGCLRLKSHAQLQLARPDFFRIFQRNLQGHHLHLERQQQQQYLERGAPLQRSPHLSLTEQSDEFTIMCNQELTATILAFLRDQQAGARDEAPRSESELQGSTLGHESFSSADGAALQSGHFSITFSRGSVSDLPRTSLGHQFAARSAPSSRAPYANPDAGAGRAHSSGRASQPAPGCSPVWHTNPCCVASPDAPVEVLGPAPGAGAGTAGAPHEDGSASPPDPASAEPADGWQVQQQGGRLGSGAPAWASPPLPRVRVPRPAPLTQPSASACSGLLLGLACENSSRSSSREQEGWAEAPCGMAGAGEQQQQQQQQQQQLSRVQQQLRALEDLQLPQPGGVTPAKLRQHTSRRTQLWDEQSSSNRVSRRPLSLSLQSMDGIRWDDGLMMRGGGSLDASIAGSKGDGGGLQSGRVPWSARGSSSGSGCSSFELGSAPERRNQEGEGGLDAETKDKAALRFAQRLAQASDAQRAPPHPPADMQGVGSSTGDDGWGGGCGGHRPQGTEEASSKGRGTAVSRAWMQGRSGSACASSGGRGRRSSAPVGLRPVPMPMPSPACGGASALEQCRQSSTGSKLRAGAAETAAALAVVRAAQRSSSSSTPRPTPSTRAASPSPAPAWSCTPLPAGPAPAAGAVAQQEGAAGMIQQQHRTLEVGPWAERAVSNSSPQVASGASLALQDTGPLAGSNEPEPGPGTRLGTANAGASAGPPAISTLNGAAGAPASPSSAVEKGGSPFSSFWPRWRSPGAAAASPPLHLQGSGRAPPDLPLSFWGL